jgi:hypothetical protein
MTNRRQRRLYACVNTMVTARLTAMDCAMRKDFGDFVSLFNVHDE